MELYVEDLDHPAVSASYSIQSRSWITRPKRDIGPFDVDEIKRLSTVWGEIIRHSLRSKNIKTARKTLDLLRKFRHLGLKTQGEYSTANLVYKTLRNSNLIRKLQNYINSEHERNLSIPD